jgi:hypothetical protein
MLPARVGELFIGAVIAYIINKYKMTSGFAGHFVNTALSIICFAIICFSFYFISEDQTFPGLIAIPPTLGTGILIFLGHQITNIVKQSLSLPIFVWIGKLSYSAYLWHWLILAFYRYFFTSITFIDALIVVVSTFILSYLSYTYIEVPYRRTEGGFLQVLTNQYLIPSTLISIIVLVSLMTNGHGFRNDRDKFLSSLEVDERMIMKHPFSFEYICHPTSISSKDLTDPRCVIGNKTDQTANVMLWGDSNSTHYIGIIGSFAQEAEFAFRNIAIGGCPPVLSDPTGFVSENWRENCLKSKPLLNEYIDDYEVLIIAASWSSYQSRSTTFINELKETLNSLVQRKKRVILLGKAPVFDKSYDPICKKKKLRVPWLNCVNQPYTISHKVITINEALRQFADSSKYIEYYDFNKYICPSGTCYAYDKQGLPIYRDKFHISIEASWRIGEKIIQAEGIPYPFNKINEWLIKTEK